MLEWLGKGVLRGIYGWRFASLEVEYSIPIARSIAHPVETESAPKSTFSRHLIDSKAGKELTV